MHHTVKDETDLSLSMAYNAASQIVSQNRSNLAFSWTLYSDVDRTYARNGLNQYSGTTVGGSSSAAFEHDANGNLKKSTGYNSDGTAVTTSYVYDGENRLVSASGGHTANLVYDPLGRLFQTSGGSAGTTQFLYDGDTIVAEYGGGGTVLRRYVHGAGEGAPRGMRRGAPFALQKPI